MPVVIVGRPAVTRIRKKKERDKWIRWNKNGAVLSSGVLQTLEGKNVLFIWRKGDELILRGESYGEEVVIVNLDKRLKRYIGSKKLEKWLLEGWGKERVKVEI